MFRPGFDLETARQERADAGKPEWFGEDDLYADVRPALSKLRESGTWVGIAGNQTVRAGGLLRGLELPTDFIATSDDWGVQKPDVAFFERVIDAAQVPADQILYVGDRIDNDITPAKKAGLKTAYIQRGPWGWILRDNPEVAELSDWRIHSLNELPGIVAAENSKSN